MAAKIKEGLRDITQGVVERLKGGPKYADNLLGESLQDQLRKATAKDLLSPSEELNSQVVDTINQDVANGKDTKEIVGLLKKRLRTDNPHKQWLAVLLVGRVMKDCSSSIGIHQEELLQEVARTMARPARPDSSSGRTTRQAAKELLRSYGRAGTSAFRAVNRQTPAGVVAVDHKAAAANSETASVVAEVQMLIEHAQANTELLSEMLLVTDPQQQQQQGGAAASGSSPTGQAASGGDEFENELTLELVTEVRELRTLFDAYLEQLQSMSGPEVEAIMMKALEAVDLLDGALALQQDVASNQRELEQQASLNAAGGGAAAAGGSKPAGSAGGAAATAPQRDLIDLDDLADALLPQPPPVLDGAAPAAAAGAPAAAAPVAVPPQAQAADPLAGLDIAAIQQVGSPLVASPSAVAPSYTGGVYAGAAPMAGVPPYGAQQPFSYTQQPHVLPAYGSYGAPTPAAYGAVAAPPPAATNPNNPFATNVMPALPYGATVPVITQAMSANNPFANAPTALTSPGGSVPAVAPQPLPTAGSCSTNQSVDAEWAMFFADRTGASAAPGQQQQQPVGSAR